MMRHGIAILMLAGLASLGCTERQEAAARQDADEAKQKSAQTGDEAKQKAEDAAEKLGQAAETAGEKIKDAAETVKETAEDPNVRREVKDDLKKAGDKAAGLAGEAAREVKAAKQVVDVKAALMGDTQVDSSHIDVSASDETKTLTLRGTVKTAAEKARAEQIARDKADGLKVVSELKVSG